MFSKLKKIKLEDIIELIIITISFIPGMLLRIIKKDIWIVSENGDDAKDNGYAFFKYLMENNKKKDVYYVIKKDSIYYNKLKEYPKNILYRNTIKHNIYTIAATKYISSQIGSGLPFPKIVFNLQGTFIYRFKSVFLQHGITQNKVPCLFPKESKVDLFCCAGNKEYDFVINELGYKEESVKKTGFCRYDVLRDESKNDNKILIMFTWRKEFENNEENFLNSKYYKTIQELLNNRKLINFLENSNLDAYICLHDNMMKYKDKFISLSKSIKIVDKTEKSIQELLRESKYLITDYSSIAFDFAYMKKPLQYFQFDYDDFRKNHLEEGYWNYDDGFGEVTYTVEEAIDELIKSYNNNFEMEEKYINKIKDFYIFFDNNNSERTYKGVKEMKTEKNNIDSWWIVNLLIFIVGFIFSQLYILLASSIIGVVLNIIYSKRDFKKNIYYIIFNIVFFTFLLSKPLVSILTGRDWISRFSVYSHKNVFLLLIMSLLSIYIGARIAQKRCKCKEDIQIDRNKNELFANIALILFFICSFFSIITEYDKLIYMKGREYVEYYLTYQSSFNPIMTFMAGMSNNLLCIFLATMPKKKKVIIPLGVFLLYNLPTFLIGQRTPLIVSALFILAYFIIRDHLDNTTRWVGKLEKRILIIMVPITIVGLSIFNYLRVDEELPTNNFIGLFGDFFYSQGVTYDVLNIGYTAKGTIKDISNHNYTFGGFIDYFKYSTISQKLFGIEDLPPGNNITRALESNSYSHILSYLKRNDYLEGHGWGSSYILETYTDFGHIGVIAYSLILGYALIKIPELLKKNKLVASIVLVSTLNIFIIPRAEALQFLQFIITPQFWGAWIMTMLIFNGIRND